MLLQARSNLYAERFPAGSKSLSAKRLCSIYNLCNFGAVGYKDTEINRSKVKLTAKPCMVRQALWEALAPECMDVL